MKKIVSILSFKKEPQTLSFDNNHSLTVPNTRRPSLFSPRSEASTTQKSPRKEDTQNHQPTDKRSRRNTIQLLLSPFMQKEKKTNISKGDKTDFPIKIILFGAPKCGRTTLVQNFFLKQEQKFVHLIIHKMNNIVYEKKGNPYMKVYFGNTTRTSLIMNGVLENQNFVYNFHKDDIPKEKIIINIFDKEEIGCLSIDPYDISPNKIVNIPLYPSGSLDVEINIAGKQNLKEEKEEFIKSHYYPFNGYPTSLSVMGEPFEVLLIDFPEKHSLKQDQLKEFFRNCHGFIFMMDFMSPDLNDIMEYSFLTSKLKDTPFVSYLALNKMDLADDHPIQDEDMERWQKNLIKGKKLPLYQLNGLNLENVEGIFEDMTIQINGQILVEKK